MTTFLELRGIGKRFFGVPVLEDIGFRLGEGEVLGLVGENGAGKSTLMNLLGGIHAPDAGEIELAGRPYAARSPADAAAAGIAFIHQELNLFGNLTVAENLHLTRLPRRRLGTFTLPVIDRRSLRDRTRALLDAVGLGVSPEARVEDLSAGERQLVEISKSVGTDARLILFDEPTTSLTWGETERLFELIERLRRRRISMIYISHNLGEVFRLSDRLLILRDGRVAGEGRKEEFTIERAISLMVGGLSGTGKPPAEPEAPPATATETEIPPDVPLLEVRGISRPGVLRDITFELCRGEILGLAGLMGSGRTELARAIFGLDPLKEGEILLDGRPLRPSPRECVRRGVALVTEDRRAEGLLLEAAVAENIALASLPRLAGPLRLIRSGELRRQVTAAARAVRLHAADLEGRPAKTLSGGNQQKTVLARWLLREPRLFLLDEPTRGIDVGARGEIHELIRDLARRGAGVLLISSEIEELLEICHRILVLSRGEIRDRLDRSAFDRERVLRAAFGREASR